MSLLSVSVFPTVAAASLLFQVSLSPLLRSLSRLHGRSLALLCRASLLLFLYNT